MAKYIIDIPNADISRWIGETPLGKKLYVPVSVEEGKEYSIGTGIYVEKYSEPDLSPLVYFKAEPISQTAKADKGKLRLTLVPRQIIREIAKIRMFGCKKYKNPEIWREIEIDRLKDAAFRHFLAYLDNPSGVDEESGLPHISHLACNIAFIIENELGGDNGRLHERLPEDKREIYPPEGTVSSDAMADTRLP